MKTYANKVAKIYFSNTSLYLISIILLTIYIVYAQYEDCGWTGIGVQIDRYHNFLEGNSEFYNPWQYRVFSYFLVYLTDYFINFLRIDNSLYYSFLIIKVFQIILLLALFIVYLKKIGIKSEILILVGLQLVAYSITNSFYKSDLSLNIYFDIIFYLSIIILLQSKIYYLLIPIVAISALNRETSGFISFIIFAYGINFQDFKHSDKRLIKIAILSLVVYVSIFFGIRYYYGFEESQGIHGMTSPLDYLLFNLSFKKLLPLLLGTFGILPIIIIWYSSKLSSKYRYIFFTFIPIWFVIHLFKSTIVETRLFLVVQILIIIPLFLKIIKKVN